MAASYDLDEGVLDKMPDPQTSLKLLGVTSSGPSDVASPTAEYLKALSVTMLDILNTKDFNVPELRHIAPDIDSHHDAASETINVTSKQSLIDTLRAMTDALPNYHAEFLDSGARVSERTGKGTVWVLRLLSGLPDGLRWESVSALTWERRDGTWYCTKHRGLRGVPWRDFKEANFSGDLGDSDSPGSSLPSSQEYDDMPVW